MAFRTGENRAVVLNLRTRDVRFSRLLNREVVFGIPGLLATAPYFLYSSAGVQYQLEVLTLTAANGTDYTWDTDVLADSSGSPYTLA